MICSLHTSVVYADNTTLFLPTAHDASTYLSCFSEAAALFGLKISWAKSKLRNPGSGLAPASISTINGSIVEAVDSSVYLGSLQSSNGYCNPELIRRASLA